jgi:hypothetical protein
VSDKVLKGGEHVFLVAEIAIALKALDCGDAETRDEIWIFAVSLLNAAPARLPSHIDDGRESLMGAAQASLERGHREERFDQFGMECGAEGDRLRKACAVWGCVAVETLLMKDDGDAEAGVLKEEALDGVGQLRHRTRFFAATGIAGAPHLTEAAAVAERLLRLSRIEVSLFVTVITRKDHRRNGGDKLSGLARSRGPAERGGARLACDRGRGDKCNRFFSERGTRRPHGSRWV